MKRWSMGMAVAATLVLGGGVLAKSPPPKPEATCGEFGTSVQFEDTPADAAKQALKDEKLVMILHISGHFENPGLT